MHIHLPDGVLPLWILIVSLVILIPVLTIAILKVRNDKKKFLEIFNNSLKGKKSKVIIFNITSNKEITCVIKKGDKYFLIKLYPKLDLSIRNNERGKSIIFQLNVHIHGYK